MRVALGAPAVRSVSLDALGAQLRHVGRAGRHRGHNRRRRDTSRPTPPPARDTFRCRVSTTARRGRRLVVIGSTFTAGSPMTRVTSAKRRGMSSSGSARMSKVASACRRDHVRPDAGLQHRRHDRGAQHRIVLRLVSRRNSAGATPAAAGSEAGDSARRLRAARCRRACRNRRVVVSLRRMGVSHAPTFATAAER